MMKLTRQRLLASTLLVGSAVVAVPAFAQTAVPQSTETVTQQPNTASPVENPQDSEQTATSDIVVTGTLIRNPNLVASNPVSVIGADEIDLKQVNVAEQLLRELPGTVPSIGSAVNNGNGGASFVNLRGIGENRNLVLLDGVRLVPGTLSGLFDLNNIPLALVQRVDVLTGGASTTYGADAISGVVNFITRTDFSGIDLNVSNQITERGDGAIFRADLAVGANFEDGRGNAVLAVGYQEADPVFQGKRDISINQIDSFTGGIGGSGTSVPSRFSGVNPTGADSVTGGANVQGTRQINAAGTAFLTSAAFSPFNFNPDNIFQTPFKRYNIYGAANYEISDHVEVYNRAIFSKNQVNTIIAPSGAFGIPVSISLNNPFLTTAQRNAFCAFDTNPGVGYTPRFSQAVCDAAATANPTITNAAGQVVANPNYRQVDNVLLFRRATEVGPRISEYTTTFFDYRAGVRGNIVGNIGYDLFGSYGESENTQRILGYTLNSRFRQSLLVVRNADGSVSCQDDSNGCIPTNVFGPRGAISAASAAFLQGTSSSQIRVTQAQARGTISGDFGVTSPFATEALSFAVGGEYRKYTARQQSDSLSASGDLGGAGGATPNIQGGYDVYEAIGEVVVPLIADRTFFQSLQLEGGIRYSSYTVDAPGNPKFNTTTYKGAGSWEPFTGFKFRGNYSKAVRAPNIGELFSPINTTLTNLSDDPCANLDDAGALIPGRPTPTGTLRDVCIAQGAPVGTIGAIAVPTSGQANQTGGGNVNLGPEQSESFSAGAVLTPAFLPGFSASIDYYNIIVTGAVSSPTPDDVINACFGAGNLSATNPACTAIRRNPIDGSLSGDSATTLGLPIGLSNLGRIKTDGIDLIANYTRDLGIFGLSLGFTGNWTNTSKFKATPSAIYRECVGLYSVNCSSIQPEFAWTQRTTFSFDDIDLSVLWRHIDKVEYEFADTAPAYSGPVASLGGRNYNFNRIPAYNYIDLTGRFAATENFSLTITVMNLFDKKPPLVGNTIGATAYNSGNTFPSTYDAVGRRFAFAARIRY